MVGSLASIAVSNVSRSMWAGPGSMKISVEAHQIMTTRSTCLSSRKRLMSSRIASSIVRLRHVAHDVVGVDVLDVGAIERRLHRADVAQRLGDLLDVLAGVEHPGPLGGDVGVVGERVPGAEHDVVERGDRCEVLDHRAAIVGALAEADRVHQGQRSDRLGQAALHQLDAGDEGGGDGAEADGQDAEAPVGRAHGRGRRSRHVAQARGRRTAGSRVQSTGVTAIVMDGTGPA